MKAILKSNWFVDGSRYRKGLNEFPDDWKDRLPKYTQVVEEDYEPEPPPPEPTTLHEVDPERANSDAYSRIVGDQYNMVSPAAQDLIIKHGFNVEDIPGTGKDGRITKYDVDAHIERNSNGG